MDTVVLQKGQRWIQMYCRGSRDGYSCIAERAKMDADVL